MFHSLPKRLRSSLGIQFIRVITAIKKLCSVSNVTIGEVCKIGWFGLNMKKVIQICITIIFMNMYVFLGY